MNTELRSASSSNDAGDLFDYDAGLDGLFQEAPTISKIRTSKLPTAGDTSGLGLGLDEEVKVSRKRQPVAKLDEGRLFSQHGIPKLRRTAKLKLKFKGKGHEFSDAARLLNFYQLWLDDLFPRAKFADGLAIIERLGHTKRLQTMRKEWIDEDKQKLYVSGGNQATPQRPLGSLESYPNDQRAMNAEKSRLNGGNDQSNEISAQLLSDDTLLQQREEGHESHADREPLLSGGEENARHPGVQYVPEDDELDALLKEQEDRGFASTRSVAAGTELESQVSHSGFSDELEAMEFGVFGAQVT